MSTMSPIQISQITSVLSALALLWLAAVVPVGMALLWRVHGRLVRQQTAAIVKAVRLVGKPPASAFYKDDADDSR